MPNPENASTKLRPQFHVEATSAGEMAREFLMEHEHNEEVVRQGWEDFTEKVLRYSNIDYALISKGYANLALQHSLTPGLDICTYKVNRYNLVSRESRCPEEIWPYADYGQSGPLTPRDWHPNVLMQFTALLKPDKDHKLLHVIEMKAWGEVKGDLLAEQLETADEHLSVEKDVDKGERYTQITLLTAQGKQLDPKRLALAFAIMTPLVANFAKQG